jgi:hypothetical protein
MQAERHFISIFSSGHQLQGFTYSVVNNLISAAADEILKKKNYYDRIEVFKFA